MKKFFTSPGGILALLILVAAATFWGLYNRLVGLDEGVAAAWGQVENVYQRRTDLIPNLIETVKGVGNYERETLQAVVDARASVGRGTVQGPVDAQQLQAFQTNQANLSNALSRLLVVAEKYPELKATDAYRDLMHQLEGAENRIAVERKRYNEAARELNTARRRFPAVLIADNFGFSEKPYFEAEEGAKQLPKVDFSK